MTAFFSKTSMLSFLEEIFPQVNGKIEILSLTDTSSSVKLRIVEGDLRPGGTVSGPSMFLLADVAFYIAVLAAIGKQPLAVTTNCSINFMRKPNPKDLIADARILKQGRSLMVGDVLLRSSMEDLTVAQASFTYAIPRKEL